MGVNTQDVFSNCFWTIAPLLALVEHLAQWLLNRALLRK